MPRGPGRDDERDDRARDNDENECDEQERREELVVHDKAPDLSSPGLFPAIPLGLHGIAF
jgi:hypothetical protein